MPQGRDFKVHIQNAGATDYVEIDSQGDLDFNFGKTVNTEKTKNNQQSYVTDEGVSGSFTVDITNPLHSSHTQLLTFHDSEGLAKIKVEDSTAGGLAFHGTARIVVGSVGAPVEGVQRAQVTFSFEPAPTRTVSPVAYA